MWISLNNAFVSIVEAPNDAAMLVVRARRAGDLESLFPGCEVVELDGRDYSFRTLQPRATVAVAIAEKVSKINYGNFKNSVRDDKLHNAYAAVWGVMARLQKRAPYSRRAAPRKPSKTRGPVAVGSLFQKGGV